MRDLECFFGYPVLLLSLEVPECERALGRPRVALLELLGVVRVRPRVHVPDIVLLRVEGKLAKRRKLLRVCQHLHQPLVVRLVMLDFHQSRALTLTREDYFVQLHTCRLELQSQRLYLQTLFLDGGLIRADLSTLDMIDNMHLGKFTLAALDLLTQPFDFRFARSYIPLHRRQLIPRKLLHLLGGHLREMSLAGQMLQLCTQILTLILFLLNYSMHIVDFLIVTGQLLL